jgi:large-conductance mechanosensitive channel
MSRKNLVRALIGALLGAGVGFGFMTLAFKIGVPSKTLQWSDFLAIWMGIVFVAFGILMGWLSVNRLQLAKALQGQQIGDEPAEEPVLPATNDEVKQAIMQAVVLVLAGLMLLGPILAQGPIKSNPMLAGYFYAGIFVLFLVQTALNIQLWRTGDEYLQRTLLVISAGTFVIGQGVLFLYAAAERLHLLPGISSWDVITHLLTLYLLVSFYVGLKQRR